jgi:acetyl esterase/lipase
MIRTAILFLLFSAALYAAEPQVIPIWPGVAPGSETWTQKETTAAREGSHSITNVTTPTLTVFPADAKLANGTAVVVCPGGGFTQLVFDKEGTEIARWLNTLGITAFVLKYRLMMTGDGGENDPGSHWERSRLVRPLAVADGEQAVRLVRKRAAEFGVAPERIGIMGFSAGGYVAAGVAMSADAASRPNFAVPVYPAVPLQISVPANAPPLFLVHASDDEKVDPIGHSVRLYAAWKQAQAPAELHIYASGGHGFALRRPGQPVQGWADRFREWLDALGMFHPSTPKSGVSGTPVKPLPAAAGK